MLDRKQNVLMHEYNVINTRSGIKVQISTFP